MKLKHSIILVDDDTDDREIIRDAFLKCDDRHDFTALEDGNSLIEFLQSHLEEGLPSIILLDLNMPGKDGREILKELKSDEHFRPVPIIVFTTSSAVRDKNVAYNLGANCFITKPDTFSQLAELAGCICRLWLK